jgi:hypothetical protein
VNGAAKYDLRPLIEMLSVITSEWKVWLKMTLAAREGATGRPEEVLTALGSNPKRCAWKEHA